MTLVRKAEKKDMDAIYLMGLDVWSAGNDAKHYLEGCKNSSKYDLGQWYVLVEKDTPVASLIVYHNHFGLEEYCYGIGSIATSREFRNKGYASRLIDAVTELLFSKQNARLVFLFSDIDIVFYEKRGFERASGPSSCMFKKKDMTVQLKELPYYF